MSAPTTAPARTVTGVQLAVTSEPLDLKRALRALAEEQPETAAARLVHPAEGVARHLWHRWGAPLEHAGIPHAAFLDVLAGYHRELWYWLWGNRTWRHCTQGLAGRLIRRAEHPSPAPTRGGHHG